MQTFSGTGYQYCVSLITVLIIFVSSPLPTTMKLSNHCLAATRRSSFIYSPFSMSAVSYKSGMSPDRYTSPQREGGHRALTIGAPNGHMKKTIHGVGKVLTMDTLPKKVIDVEYSVRGPVVTRSIEIEKDLKANPGKYPFNEIVPANIGNPQAVGQSPITFFRQYLSCILSPHLATSDTFPSDVVQRARHSLSLAKSFGAYSHSKGHLCFREEVAKWLTARDGYEADPESVFLTNGASAGVSLILELLLSSSDSGVMIPIPQYPLYSSTITRLGGTSVGYYLDEESGWSVSVDEVVRELSAKRSMGVDVKALVVINPGNPTGAVLPRDVIEQLVRLCEREGLLLMADEVYQDNVYGEVPFVSVRKVVKDLQSPVELVSFHSASKGFYGECGLRGGLMYLDNIDEEVMAQLYKLASTGLCPNTVGQALMAAIVNPPVEGDPSFALYKQERDEIKASLKRKAKMVADRLNSIKGIRSQPVEGAMYAFPSIDVPPVASGCADAKYCMTLLEKTGIVAVPGSGFGQRPSTNHVRLTILPQEDKLPNILDRFESFHKEYTKT